MTDVMRIRRLGRREEFREFSDAECAWCEAAYKFFSRRNAAAGDTLHLENERGAKRTVTWGDDGMRCEPYVFFRDDDD